MAHDETSGCRRDGRFSRWLGAMELRTSRNPQPAARTALCLWDRDCLFKETGCDRAMVNADGTPLCSAFSATPSLYPGSIEVPYVK